MSDHVSASAKIGVPLPLFVGILASFGDDAVNTAIMPMMASVAKTFPDIPYTTVVWLYTMPKIIIIPFALLGGFLAGRKVGFKPLALVSLGIISVAGVVPAFFDDFWAILASRMVLAVGLGLQAPIGPALVMRFFKDGKKRSFALGIGNATLNAYSILTGLAVGLLCSIDWHMSFFAYAGMAILFFATLFLLKEPPALEDDDGGEEACDVAKGVVSLGAFSNGRGKLKVPAMVVVLCAAFAIVDCVWMPASLNMSSILSAKGWGDSATAAFLMSFISASGLAAGSFYGFYYRLMGRYNLAASMLIMACALLSIYFANGVVMVGVGLILGGASFTLIICGIQNEFGFICTPAQMAFAMGLFMVFEHLGGFMTSWYMVLVMDVFGMESLFAPIGVAAVLFLVGSLGFVGYARCGSRA